MQNNAHPHPHLAICDRRKKFISSKGRKVGWNFKKDFCLNNLQLVLWSSFLSRKLEIKTNWQNGSMNFPPKKGKKESLNFRLWGVGGWGSKGSPLFFFLLLACWLIFCCGLDALAIGQCGSFHHLQRGFPWFKWGPPWRTLLLDHLSLVFPQRWDLLIKWKHRHYLQLRNQTMIAPFCSSTFLLKLRFMYITSTSETIRRLLNSYVFLPTTEANHFKGFSLRLAIYRYVFLQDHGKSPQWTSEKQIKSLSARWSKQFPQTLAPHPHLTNSIKFPNT